MEGWVGGGGGGRSSRCAVLCEVPGSSRCAVLCGVPGSSRCAALCCCSRARAAVVLCCAVLCISCFEAGMRRGVLLLPRSSGCGAVSCCVVNLVLERLRCAVLCCAVLFISCSTRRGAVLFLPRSRPGVGLRRAVFLRRAPEDLRRLLRPSAPRACGCRGRGVHRVRPRHVPPRGVGAAESHRI